jgi:replicative DNA helicase
MLAAIMDSENGAREFMKIDPAPELFRGAEVEIYEFVKSHIQKHGVIPNRETVKKHLPEVSLPSDVPEPPSYYHERIKKRHQHLTLKKALQDSAELLNNDDPEAAEEILFKTMIDLRRTEFRRRVVDYAQEGAGIIKDHMVGVLKGLGEGIPFGWPSVDKDSLGKQAGDFISFIGRPGKGKTFMLLYHLMHSWKSGFSPMFVSMEMTPKLIVQRLAALDTHTSATQIKMATVSKKKSSDMMAILIDNKNRPPVWVIDGGLNATVDDLVLQCLEKKPDEMYIDGAYLLRAANSKIARWERIADNAERTKQEICEGLQIPVSNSYQFNRDAAKEQKKGKVGGLESIAGADQIGQLSSLVFGMLDEHNDTVEGMDQRVVEILKGRNGEIGQFRTHWIFDVFPFMDFSEIKEETLDDLSNL